MSKAVRSAPNAPPRGVHELAEESPILCPLCGNKVAAGLTTCPVCSTDLQKAIERKAQVTGTEGPPEDYLHKALPGVELSKSQHVCPQCGMDLQGNEVRCPRCSIPLVGEEQLLECHKCGTPA